MADFCSKRVLIKAGALEELNRKCKMSSATIDTELFFNIVDDNLVDVKDLDKARSFFRQRRTVRSLRYLLMVRVVLLAIVDLVVLDLAFTM